MWLILAAMLPSALADAPTARSALFLGNSYTSSIELDERTAEVMLGAVPNLEEMHTIRLAHNGHQLSHHLEWLLTDPRWQAQLGGDVAWDHVILQDQSQVPGFEPDDPTFVASREAVVLLDAAIRETGAETVLLLTWGRRDGDRWNPEIYPDYTTMQERLETGYLAYKQAIEDAGGGPVAVAPAGRAFSILRDAEIAAGRDPLDPESLFYRLYVSDGSHPSTEGGYLAACVVAATLSGWPVSGTAYSGSLDLETVEALQAAADMAVFSDPFSVFDYSWALDWDELSDGGASELVVSHPQNRLLARITGDEGTLSQLTLGAMHDDLPGTAELRVQAGGRLGVESLVLGEGGGDSLLRVEGGDLRTTFLTGGTVELVSGSLSALEIDTDLHIQGGMLHMVGDEPRIGVSLELPEGSVLRIDSASGLEVEGGASLNGMLELPAAEALGAGSVLPIARFTEEPSIEGLELLTPPPGDWSLVLSAADAGWSLDLVVAGAEPGEVDEEPADTADEGSALEAAPPTTRSSSPAPEKTGGCGKAAALPLLLLGLRGLRRRQRP